jgi:putative membrane protein
MRRVAVPAVLVGLVAAGLLLDRHDPGAILAVLRKAGWWIALPVLLHLPQVLASAIGWDVLIARDARPGIARSFAWRWIKEAANALLPLAQVGGDAVRIRLFAQRGAAAREGAAVGLADVATEMAAQIVFTLIGLAALVTGPHAIGAGRLALGLAAAVAAFGVALILVVRFGVARLIERLARGRAGRMMGDLAGLQAATAAMAGRRMPLLRSVGWHLGSWLLGAVESYGALVAIGAAPTWHSALVIEVFAQGARAAGFVIPGALGVQEGGYLLVAAMIGLPTPAALALSAIRRIRDLAIGLPGMALWYGLEIAPKAL